MFSLRNVKVFSPLVKNGHFFFFRQINRFIIASRHSVPPFRDLNQNRQKSNTGLHKELKIGMYFQCRTKLSQGDFKTKNFTGGGMRQSTQGRDLPLKPPIIRVMILLYFYAFTWCWKILIRPVLDSRKRW